MPRVLRRKKKQRAEGRPLTGREYWQIRLRPEGFYPEWACAQVEANIRRIAGMPSRGLLPVRPTLDEWLALRAGFKEANKTKQEEYEAYVADPKNKPEWA